MVFHSKNCLAIESSWVFTEQHMCDLRQCELSTAYTELLMGLHSLILMSRLHLYLMQSVLGTAVKVTMPGCADMKNWSSPEPTQKQPAGLHCSIITFSFLLPQWSSVRKVTHWALFIRVS